MLKVIEHHSASSGNTFIDCPHMWIIDKLYGFESEPNARMVMGLAAEDAAHYALSNQITDQDSITDYSVRKYLEHKGITGDDLKNIQTISQESNNSRNANCQGSRF